MSISTGNMKLGGIPNVSLPPIKSCANCAACRKDCYALKAYRRPSVRASWDSNMTLASTNPAEYFGRIADFIERKAPKFFRFHVAGDILNADYLARMYALARQFPRVRFLAFTKRFDLSFRGRPDNITIVFSAWPGYPVPRRRGIPIAWMQNGTETRVPTDAIECPGNCETCGLCWTLPKIGRDVVFHKH